MVLLEGDCLNSLFSTLADWEAQLKAVEVDIPRDFGGPEP
jgi:hypothetical protein